MPVILLAAALAQGGALDIAESRGRRIPPCEDDEEGGDEGRPRRTGPGRSRGERPGPVHSVMGRQQFGITVPLLSRASSLPQRDR